MWYLCLSVCLFVTRISQNIIDGFEPNFVEWYIFGNREEIWIRFRDWSGYGSGRTRTCYWRLVLCWASAGQTTTMNSDGDEYSSWQPRTAAVSTARTQLPSSTYWSPRSHGLCVTRPHQLFSLLLHACHWLFNVFGYGNYSIFLQQFSWKK